MTVLQASESLCPVESIAGGRVEEREGIRITGGQV